MLYSPIPKYEIYEIYEICEICEICEIREICEICEICEEALTKASYQKADQSGDRITLRLNDPYQ